MATVLTTNCPSCERIVVFVINGLDDFEMHPSGPNQRASSALIDAGTQHSAYVRLRSLVRSATQRLWIVDPYADSGLLDLAGNADESVQVRLLTHELHLPADFPYEAELFTKQRAGQFEVRVGIEDLHDRFLVVDEKVYLSGGSFKDLGRKVSTLIETNDLNAHIIAMLEERWNSASSLLPNRGSSADRRPRSGRQHDSSRAVRRVIEKLTKFAAEESQLRRHPGGGPLVWVIGEETQSDHEARSIRAEYESLIAQWRATVRTFLTDACPEFVADWDAANESDPAGALRNVIRELRTRL